MLNRELAKDNSGAIMYLLMFATATTSILVTTMLLHTSSTQNNIKSFLQAKKAFYAVEGTRAIATQVIQNYLNQTTTPTTAGINNALTTNATALTVSGYSLLNSTVSLLGYTPVGVIPNGVYSGMVSPLSVVDLNVKLRSTTSLITSVVDSTMTLGQVFPFQFMQFFDRPYADWASTAPAMLNGWTHINGDFCAATSAGGTGAKFAKITASGRIMHLADTRCLYSGVQYNGKNVSIATDNTFTNFAPLKNPDDNGCVNCGGGGTGWVNYATNLWNGNVKDQAMAVPTLKLPGEGTNNSAQYGVDGPNFTTTSNQDNMRFILDPPFGTDSSTISSQKFANNADIRIIDGVWYLKDPTNTFNWPGIPIWSDHPGAADAYNLRVGQDDIRAYWQTHGYPWPVGTTPKLYSYYDYSTTGLSLAKNNTTNTQGVVSYGNLVNTGASAWQPAAFIDNSEYSGGSSSLCGAGSILSCGPGAGLTNAISSPANCGGQIMTCSGATPPPPPGVPTLVLDATRGGFASPQIFYDSPAPNQGPRSRVYPVNFDVGVFQTALNSTAPGELGSYFGNSSFMGRSFNGIIYITQNWPGSLNGFGTGLASPYPYQGSITDAAQINVTGTEQQRALPANLCSNSAALVTHPGLAVVSPANSFDSAAGYVRFKIPDCASYAGSSPAIASFPNALRVFNGGSLVPANFQAGFSLVTNLPIYILGDYNATSNVATSTSTPWVSSLLAGDWMTIQSNNWTDSYSPWTPGAQTITAYTSRPAATTKVQAATITGFAEGNLKIQGALAFVEDWLGKNFNYTGSLVVGFYPVYQPSHVTIQAFGPPTRNFLYDPHFTLPVNQPPGSPIYPTSAVSKWYP